MSEPTDVSGATLGPAATDTHCPCGVPVVSGDLVFQPLGLPELYCVACGLSAMRLGEPKSPRAETSIDVADALRTEYQVRVALGWDTPRATLVVDPDDGPVWRLGVPENDSDLGHGALNGDRVEITLYQPLYPERAP